MSQTEVPALREEAKKYPRGIRFQLSTLLLLSTLNGIALAGFLVLLFTTFQGQRSETMIDLREIAAGLTSTHDSLLLAAAAGEEPAIGRVRGNLVTAQGRLEALALENSDDALAALADYAQACDRWWMAGWGPEATPLKNGEAGVAGAKGAEALLIPMARAHRRVLGEVALLADRMRPRWFDQAVTWARYGVTWVVLVAIITLIVAMRLQKVLSLPLEQLTLATEKVSGGDLHTEIPRVASLRSAPEIAALGKSVEAMRQRLVHSIRDLDGRNGELATILNSLIEGVIVLSSDGSITEASPRVPELLADRVDDTAPVRAGTRLLDLFDDLPDDILEAHVGEELALAIPLIRGKTRYLTLTIAPMRTVSGRPTGSFVAVLRDVTDEHEVETLKREFLSVVTHELKTPLTAIEGYAKLLLMGKGGGLSEKQMGYARTITDQTGALRSMIQNLLDTTRLEGGNLPIDAAPTDPAELMTEAAESFRASAQTRGLTVELKSDDFGDARIRVDPFRMQQVLGNLISNAIKFTPEGGSIHLSAHKQGGHAALIVADTGRGIPAESLPRLFEKFYQVAKGDTRNQGGAGLGLYICKELVRVQGGAITADSTPGKGSRFTLRFPLIPQPGGEV